MKTFLLAGALAVLGSLPVSSRDVNFLTFAGCVGRYSAEMEHAWLLGSEDVEVIQDGRTHFLALLEATVPQGRARETLAYRIETKVAHASLLTLATFHDDPSRATAAGRTATAHLESCQTLLLGG